MRVILELGAALLGLGGVTPVLLPRIRYGIGAQIAGMVLLGATGVAALLTGGHAGSSFQSGVSPAFGVDPLSGFFLALLALAAVPTLSYTNAYVGAIKSSGASRAIVSLLAAVLLSLVGVLLARSASVFLACWELMTIVPAAMILLLRRDAGVRAAVYLYVALTHLAGAGVWIAVLLAAHHGAFGHPQALAHAGESAQALVAIAGLVGFGAKAGLIPLHSWLPKAHPVAPAPISALMSGTMVKVALYGLIRIEFDSLPTHPLWLGLALLAAGLLSTIGGVLWATAQRELKRLLAFSTIENVGIIAMALGATMLFLRAGDTLWASLAFAAALLHAVNHALFKTLLFLGAGSIERAVGSLDLDQLGGLIRRMPWTGGALLVGSLSSAAVPPLNGFASEWLTLQSLLHVVLRDPLGVALAGAIALAGLAAAAAIALICFVKVVGLVLLGNPRSTRCMEATESALPMRASMAALSIACLLFGIVPGLVLPKLTPLLSSLTAPLLTTAPVQMVQMPVHAGLLLPGAGSLPTLGIAVALLILTTLLWLARGFRAQPRTATPSWACGQPLVRELGWSSPAFTKPLRLVLQGLMRPQRELVIVDAGGMTQRILYSSQTPSLVDRILYEPTIRFALSAAAVARRLQTGSVRTYAAYLIGLVICTLVLFGAGAFR